MIARKITPTHEERNARSLELAETRQMIGTAQYIAESGSGHVWRVPSGSGHGSYDVLAPTHGGCPECPCIAGSYHRACSHAGAVLHAERQRIEATEQDEAAQAARDWWNYANMGGAVLDCYQGW